jgi:hypothetical protein
MAASPRPTLKPVSNNLQQPDLKMGLNIRFDGDKVSLLLSHTDGKLRSSPPSPAGRCTQNLQEMVTKTIPAHQKTKSL